MQNIKTTLIIFALTLLFLVGASLFLGNPKGSQYFEITKEVESILTNNNLNLEDIKACVNEKTYAENIQKDVNLGNKLEIVGTPASLLIDKNTGIGVFGNGAFPFEIVSNAIERFLQGDVSEGELLYENKDVGIEYKTQKFDLDLGNLEHFRGNSDLSLVFLVFSDLDCSYCAVFHQTVGKLIQTYQDQVLFVYKHFPLVSIHPTIMGKTNLTECAYKLGGNDVFWQLLDFYYKPTQ